MGKEFLKQMEDWKGWMPVSHKINEAKLVEVLNLMGNKAGDPPHVHEFKLKEAITTSDFSYLFGQVLERDLLARYQTSPTVWQPYTKVRTVKDFRAVAIHRVQGNDNLLDPVKEKGEYLVRPMRDDHRDLSVMKYGNQFDISWESVINDYLDAFGDLPQRFSDAVVNTEAYIVTSLFVAAAGPNPALFGNSIVDIDGQNVFNLTDVALTATNLAAVLGLMAQQTDVQGTPLGVRGIHVVVPPVLEIPARQIITSTEVRVQVNFPQFAGTKNVLAEMGLQIHINPWLPVIDVSGNGNTTWYVFADVSQGAALHAGRLRGNEQPEICMKDSNKVTMTGTHYPPFSGDFKSDNIFYRVRMVFGGVQGDPRFCYASTGIVLPS